MQITAQSALSIILPKNPSPCEKFAAEELAGYLKKIFGAAAETVPAENDAGGIRFFIGGPEKNSESAKLIGRDAFRKLVPGPEGMMIKSFGEDAVLLAGSFGDPTEDDRGTLYAVYEFLERYLGCSFASYMKPGLPGGEKVPQLDAANLSDIEYIKAESDLKYRTAIVQYGDEAGNPDHGLNLSFLNWLAKNRYNHILTWMSIYERYKENGMLEEAQKRGIRFTAGHHAASKTFLPPRGNKYFKEHYFETHPEYYKLCEDGNRFCPDNFFGQWIFCSRNEELIEQVSQNIIRWIYDNPSVDIIAFWPQDGKADQCCCEKCAKYSKIENYSYFLNAVAKRVSAVHKHVKIDMLVYVDLWKRPDGTKLDPALLVDEAVWHDTGLRTAGRPDGKSIIGTFFEKDLLDWHSTGAEVVYYDYYMGVYSNRQRWIPMADEVQALAKRYKETGVYGTGTQIECFNMWNHVFNFYTFGRTAYDCSLSMEDNLARFTEIFGGGAKDISEIVRTAEDCLDGQVPINQCGAYLMEHIDKEKIYGLFESALSKAETPAARNSIRMMRMEFRYSDIEYEAGKTLGNVKYTPLQKYDDPTGELFFLSQFDSFRLNDPGYGIDIPVECEKSDKFVPDKWYGFEE